MLSIRVLSGEAETPLRSSTAKFPLQACQVWANGGSASLKDVSQMILKMDLSFKGDNGVLMIRSMEESR